MPSTTEKEQELGGQPSAPEPVNPLVNFQNSMREIRQRREAETQEQQAALARQQEEMRPFRERLMAALNAPAPAPPPVEAAPPAPSKAVRPFMEGMPGESNVQVLNRTLMGLGLMAQMAVGISKNYAQGALAAYNGALQGWLRGDLIRGENEWQSYLEQLWKLRHDFNMRQRVYQDTYNEFQHDIDRRKTEMLLKAAEHGEERRGLELAARDTDRFVEETKLSGMLVEKMLNDANLMSFRVWAKQNDDQRQRELARDRNDTMKAIAQQRTDLARDRLEAGQQAKQEKQQQQQAGFQTMDTIITDMKGLAAKLASKGLLPKGDDPMAWAEAKKNRLLKLNDPDWRQWLALQGSMVGFERQVFDDKGARAIAVFQSMLHFVENPPTLEGTNQVLDRMQRYTRARIAGHQVPQAEEIMVGGAPLSPGAATTPAMPDFPAGGR